MQNTIYFNVSRAYRKVFLARFKGEGKPISFSRGEFVEIEFKKLGHVYFILEGMVRQYFIDKNGNERTILLLSKGDFFGEITMIQQDFDQVITKSLSDMVVCKIRKNRFYEIIREDFAINQALLQSITAKVRFLMVQLYDGNYFPIDTRLLNLLKRLAAQHGEQAGNGVRINFKLTHQELANMIGSTRSTISKTLFNFKQEGLIEIKNKQVTLTDKCLKDPYSN